MQTRAPPVKKKKFAAVNNARTYTDTYVGSSSSVIRSIRNLTLARARSLAF